MKKNEVKVGKVYVVKVSGHLVTVKLTSESPYGGWNGTNLYTGRPVRIKTAGRLRHEANILAPDPNDERGKRMVYIAQEEDYGS